MSHHRVIVTEKEMCVRRLGILANVRFQGPQLSVVDRQVIVVGIQCRLITWGSQSERRVRLHRRAGVLAIGE